MPDTWATAFVVARTGAGTCTGAGILCAEDGAAVLAGAFFAAFSIGAFFFAVFAVGAFTADFLTAVFFRASASFFAGRFTFAVATLFCAQRRRAASWIALLPAALSLRFGLAGGLKAFAALDGDCDLTAALTRATAAFAS